MRFFIFTKKQLLTVCGAVLAIAVGAAVSVGVFAKTARKLPIYCVSTEEKKVALTFDAAWGNSKKVQNLYYANFSNL